MFFRSPCKVSFFLFHMHIRVTQEITQIGRRLFITRRLRSDWGIDRQACVCKLTSNIQCIIVYLKGLFISLYRRGTIVIRRSFRTLIVEICICHAKICETELRYKTTLQNSFKNKRLIPLTTISDNWQSKNSDQVADESPTKLNINKEGWPLTW